MQRLGGSQIIDGVDGITDVNALATIVPKDSDGTVLYGTRVVGFDGSEYIYCYTALTSIVKGGCVAIGRTGAPTTAGRNPLVTLPETDDNIAVKYGFATVTLAAAGGLWILTSGRLKFARVDGDTDVAIGDWLKPVDGAQYLTQDAAVGSVRSVAGIAIAEKVVTLAYNAQTDTTNGDANVQIYVPKTDGTL